MTARLTISGRIAATARLVSLSLLLCLLPACGKDDPSLPVQSIEHRYGYGDVVSFGAHGDSHRFRATGWSSPDASGTWTDGPAASLLFEVAPPAHQLVLSMTLAGHIQAPDVPQQPVELYVNGEKITTWMVSEAAPQVATIPKSLTPGGLLVVDLHLPKATSPARFGTSADRRRLGVFCSELVIRDTTVTPTNVYNLGSVLRFGQDAGSEPFRVTGWSATEPNGTWTEGQNATLELRGLPAGKPLDLRALIGGMIKLPDLPSQPTEVYANGRLIANWQVADPPKDFRAQIPADLMKNADRLTLQFRTPRAASPQALGLSTDSRVLGLWFVELQVSEP